MQNSLFTLLFILFTGLVFSQQKEAADRLVGGGVELHEKGEYEKAIAVYDKALELDENNLLALAEKAYSLKMLERYDECIKTCELAIEKHPGEEALKTVYTTLGSTYDAMEQKDKAMETYDKGIELYPDFYLLHFNKGISYLRDEKIDEAMQSFEFSAKYNPQHASSHNALARMMNYKNNRIAALLALWRFFVLEPEGQRAQQNLELMDNLIHSGVKKGGGKSITINLNPSTFGDTLEDGSNKPNNFSITDMTLSLTAALDYDKKNKKKSQVKLLEEKVDMICSSMEEQKDENSGFYWEFYAPYFISMKAAGQVETFCYIVYASSDDDKVHKWLTENKDKVKEFYKWSGSYEWPITEK